MRVKVGELKTHLSSYLRKLEADGETLEVCVRERPVAYLVPAAGEAGDPGAAPDMAARLKAQGLLVSGAPVGKTRENIPVPRLAGDRRSKVDTIAEMRAGKDW